MAFVVGSTPLGAHGIGCNVREGMGSSLETRAGLSRNAPRIRHAVWLLWVGGFLSLRLFTAPHSGRSLVYQDIVIPHNRVSTTNSADARRLVFWGHCGGGIGRFRPSGQPWPWPSTSADFRSAVGYPATPGLARSVERCSDAGAVVALLWVGGGRGHVSAGRWRRPGWNRSIRLSAEDSS